LKFNLFRYFFILFSNSYATDPDTKLADRKKVEGRKEGRKEEGRS